MNKIFRLIFLAALIPILGACAGQRVRSEIGATGVYLAKKNTAVVVIPTEDITLHDNGVVDAGARIYLAPKEGIFTIGVGVGESPHTDISKDAVDTGARVMFIPTSEKGGRRTHILDKDSALVIAPEGAGSPSLGTALVGTHARVVKLTKGDSGYGLTKGDSGYGLTKGDSGYGLTKGDSGYGLSTVSEDGVGARATVHFLPTGEGLESEGTGIILIVPEGLSGEEEGLFVVVPSEDFTERVEKVLR